MRELLRYPRVLLLVGLPGPPLLGVDGVEGVHRPALDGVRVLPDQLAGVLELLHHAPPSGRHQAAAHLLRGPVAATAHLQALGGDGAEGGGVLPVAADLGEQRKVVESCWVVRRRSFAGVLFKS